MRCYIQCRQLGEQDGIIYILECVVPQVPFPSITAIDIVIACEETLFWDVDFLDRHEVHQDCIIRNRNDAIGFLDRRPKRFETRNCQELGRSMLLVQFRIVNKTVNIRNCKDAVGFFSTSFITSAPHCVCETSRSRNSATSSSPKRPTKQPLTHYNKWLSNVGYHPHLVY
jgi:hypothetical protein